MTTSIDKQLYLPPELQRAHERLAPEVLKMKDMLCQNNNVDARIECFISLGTFDKGQHVFDTNISSLNYHNILHMLQSYQEWKSVVLDQDSHEYFYTVTSFSEKHKPVKHYRKRKNAQLEPESTQSANQVTTSSPQPTSKQVINTQVNNTQVNNTQVNNTQTQNTQTPSYRVSSQVVFTNNVTPKMLLTHTYVNFVSAAFFNVVDSEPRVHVKVTVQKKIMIQPELLPPSVLPEFVRIRKQSFFALENWRFVFTQEWDGPTRLEAERKQQMDKCHNLNQMRTHAQTACQQKKHKIKIEFIGTREYIAAVSADYLTMSLLLKLCSLLGGNIFSIQPF